MVAHPTSSVTQDLAPGPAGPAAWEAAAHIPPPAESASAPGRFSRALGRLSSYSRLQHFSPNLLSTHYTQILADIFCLPL